MSTRVVGVPSEIKDNEKRVALHPGRCRRAGARTATRSSSRPAPGVGSRFPDDEFAEAGAKILPTADEVFAAADLIVKVKEPLPAEYHRFRPGQQLFTYLHLAADRGLTEFLLERRIDAIAYETIADRRPQAAAAHAHERSRGAHGRAGRRAPPGEPGGGRGHPARRRARHARGERRSSSAAAWSAPRPRRSPSACGRSSRVLDTNPSRLAYLVRHLRRPARPRRARTGRARPPTSPRPTS